MQLLFPSSFLSNDFAVHRADHRQARANIVELLFYRAYYGVNLVEMVNRCHFRNSGDVIRRANFSRLSLPTATSTNSCSDETANAGDGLLACPSAGVAKSPSTLN